MIIKAKINVKKILKDRMFTAKTGAVYLDLTLLEHKDGPDQYGNDGMVVQDLGKEAREAGEKGPILGNFTILKTNSKPRPAAEKSSAVDNDEPPF